MKTVYAIDMQKTISKISQKFQIESERIAQIHSRELQSTRINLSKAHDMEKDRLEKCFKEQVTALTRRHEQETKTQKDEFVLQADRVKNLKSRGFTGPSISIYAFESVLTGVLDALANSNMIKSSDADRIIDIAKSNKDPSFMASADARVLLNEILFATLKKINDNTADLEYLKSKMKRAGITDSNDAESNSPYSPLTTNSNSKPNNRTFSPDRLHKSNTSTPMRETRSSNRSSPNNRSANGTPSRVNVNWINEITDGF